MRMLFSRILLSVERGIKSAAPKRADSSFVPPLLFAQPSNVISSAARGNKHFDAQKDDDDDDNEGMLIDAMHGGGGSLFSGEATTISNSSVEAFPAGSGLKVARSMSKSSNN